MNSSHSPMDFSSENLPRNIQSCVIRLKELYTCTECNKTFAKSRSLKMHAFTHLSYLQSLKQEVKQSDKCVEYPLELEVQENEDIQSEDSYSSSEYSVLSQSKRASKLRYNPKRICQQKSFECDECKMSFKFPWRLQEHESKCGGEKSYSSDESRKSSLSLRSFAHYDMKKSKNTYVESKANQSKQHQVKIQSKGTYSCTDCSKSYMSLDVLRRHFNEKHRLCLERTYDCDKCHDQFKYPWSLQIHMGKCTSENPYPCNKCFRTFRTKDNLYKHNRKIHENAKPLKLKRPKLSSKSPFSCPDCSKLYTSMIWLRTHFSRTHKSPGETYDCNKCGEKFKYPWSLEEHDCIEEQEKPHVCCRCERSFLTLKSLGLHGQLHKKGYADKNDENNPSDDSYSCNECGKKYISCDSLCSHFIRTHKLQLTTYKCSECNDVFKYPWNLEEHVVVHTGEMPYVCCICLQSFSTLRRFSLHRKTHNVKNTSPTHNVKNTSQTHNVKNTGKTHNVKNTSKRNSSSTCSSLKNHTLVHTEEKAGCKPDKIIKRSNVDKKQKKNSSQSRKTSCRKSDASQQKRMKKTLKENEYKCGECEKLFPNFNEMNCHLFEAHMESNSEEGVNVKQDNDLSEKSKDKCQMTRRTGKLTVKKQIVGKRVKGRKYHCSECEVVLSTLSKLKHHISQIHKRESRRQVVKQGNEWEKKAYSDPKPYVCQFCSMLFTEEHFLRYHIRRIHFESNLYRCRYCSSTCETFEEYTDHKCKQTTETSNSKRRIKCNECGALFKKLSALRIHIRRKHTKEKPFKCVKCEKSFVTKHLLKQHDTAHTGIKAYQCDQCSKSYLTSGDLRNHVRRVHLEDKRYTCYDCNMSFITKTELRRHVGKHIREQMLAEGKFNCNYCGRSYTYNTRLKHHIQQVHGIQQSGINPEKKYKCDECSKTFGNLHALKQHISHVHGTAHQCDKCMKVFPTQLQLRNHQIREHSEPDLGWKCSVCDNSYCSSHYLNVHMQIHEKSVR